MCTSLSEQRIAVLTTYFNGDWHSPQPVHYHAPGCPCGAVGPDALADLQRSVVPAILPKAVPLFPRHRWTGAPQTTDEVLLLCFLHHLYKFVVPVWLQCLRGRRIATAADFATAAAAPTVVVDDVSDLGPRGVSSTALAAFDNLGLFIDEAQSGVVQIQ